MEYCRMNIQPICDRVDRASASEAVDLGLIPGWVTGTAWSLYRVWWTGGSLTRSRKVTSLSPDQDNLVNKIELQLQRDNFKGFEPWGLWSLNPSTSPLVYNLFMCTIEPVLDVKGALDYRYYFCAILQCLRRQISTTAEATVSKSQQLRQRLSAAKFDRLWARTDDEATRAKWPR